MNSVLSILLFWVGMFLLLGLVNAYRNADRADHTAKSARRALEIALTERCLEIGRLLPLDTKIQNACRDTEEAPSLTDRFHAEREVSELLNRYLSDRLPLHHPARLPEIRASIIAMENRLAPVRDRYNEAALQVNSLRGAIPSGLIGHAVFNEDLPLYPDVDSGL